MISSPQDPQNGYQSTSLADNDHDGAIVIVKVVISSFWCLGRR